MKKPKGIKGTRRQLRQATQMTASAVKHAMQEASKAIDELSAKNGGLTTENLALRNVIVGERAEALYYIERYIALSPAPIPFCDLSEAEQTRFHVEAVKKLSGIEDSPVAAAEPPRILLN